MTLSEKKSIQSLHREVNAAHSNAQGARKTPPPLPARDASYAHYNSMNMTSVPPRSSSAQRAPHDSPRSPRTHFHEPSGFSATQHANGTPNMTPELPPRGASLDPANAHINHINGDVARSITPGVHTRKGSMPGNFGMSSSFPTSAMRHPPTPFDGHDRSVPKESGKKFKWARSAFKMKTSNHQHSSSYTNNGDNSDSASIKCRLWRY
jgi:hypothetical protein